MEILENVSLSHYTTFKVGGPARYFCSVSTEKELQDAIEFAKRNKQKIFILGEGSNILISDKGFFGVVIKIEIKGVKLRKGPGRTFYIDAAAGEMWDELIEFAVKKGLYGIENLSAIPGTVGAAPVQNIGAYGCDVSESIESVRVLDRQTGKFRNLSKKQCEFEYRESLFKKVHDRYVITKVTFKLSQDGQVNISYRDLHDYFTRKANPNPTLEQVRSAVIDIRWHKLPNWKLWGTAGSFFKNPIITPQHYKRLVKKYPLLPGYVEPDGRVKVPLGWILDKICKMRGICVGNVCTHDTQALVIVTKAGAKAEDIVRLAQRLMTRVKKKTGIEVEGEVQWVN